ncbi:IS5 family transposase [Porphyromonas pogonae]|uniref:IS5 family transposase n=1 Tax=Porphyromonas pogonae TaxID=867595 RepID=UPI002E773159|nr:IS5 family transposase [Porphyromonas pogonae]
MSKEKNTNAASFAELAVERRRQATKNNFLHQIDSIVDWRPISNLLNKHCLKGDTPFGASSYRPIMLFKILLLETWYGLSDRQVEERINDSLTWSAFLGLTMDFVSPDHSTICRFRQELIEKGLMAKLFKLLNKQLKQHGIMEIKEGAIVDASIVDSPNKPTGGLQIVICDDREDTRSDQEKEAEEEYQVKVCSTKPGVDEEARWVKKCNEYRYGYKKHILTDTKGLIHEVITTAANVADTTQIIPLLEQAQLPQETMILADKGYTSKKNRGYLCDHNLIDGIMHKAVKGMPLTDGKKQLNRLISSMRWQIERSFGSIIRWFHGGRCRYRGIAKTHYQNLIESLAYNLKRAPKLLMQQNVN